MKISAKSFHILPQTPILEIFPYCPPARTSLFQKGRLHISNEWKTLGHINQRNIMTGLSKKKILAKVYSYKFEATVNFSQWSLFPLASLPSSPLTILGPTSGLDQVYRHHLVGVQNWTQHHKSELKSAK